MIMEQSAYKNLIDEIIMKQTLILGPDIVFAKARNVDSIRFNEHGKVESFKGDPEQALKLLIDEFYALSGNLVKNVLTPVFAKYPDIKMPLI